MRNQGKNKGDDALGAPAQAPAGGTPASELHPQARFQAYVFSRARALGVSRTELARRAHLSRESLYKLLRGDIANPAISTLHGLAVALEISPLHLIRQYFDDLNLGPGTLLSTHHPDDHSSFVRDVTVPDDMVVGINETFVKTWEIQNTGRLCWQKRQLACQDDDYVLARREPDGRLTAILDCHLNPSQRRIDIPETPSGETVLLSVSFTSPPLPCTAVSVWKMVDADGNLCFPEATGLWARVRVVAI